MKQDRIIYDYDGQEHRGVVVGIVSKKAGDYFVVRVDKKYLKKR